MMELRDKIEEKIMHLSPHAIEQNGSLYHKNDRYNINEECDLYGFSFDQTIYSSLNSSKYVTIDEGVLCLITKHDNWNNPGSIKLMLDAYNIKDPYITSFRSEFGKVDKDVLRTSINEFQCEKFVARGKDLLQMNDFKGALQCFDQALQITPSYKSALYYRIHLSIQAGDFQHAKGDLEKILSGDSEDASALSLLAMLPLSYRNLINHPEYEKNTDKDSSKFETTIQKLSKSLRKTNDTGAEGSDNEDESTSSSSSGSNSNNSDDKSKRKRKHKARHKRKDKKKHKKHKQSKKLKRHKKD